MSTRILLYGGRFDPPHIGHIESLSDAVGYLKPDKTLVVPSSGSYRGDNGVSDDVRIRLCDLAFSAVPGVEISDMELRQTESRNTVSTLRKIGEEYPDSELFFLLGTDVLVRLEACEDFRKILPLCSLAVINRSGSDGKNAAEHLREKYAAGIVHVPGKVPAADSTALRAALPQREGRELLTDSVYSEIIRLRLYGAKPDLLWLREEAEKYLKPSRVPHVRGCEQEAIRLAKRWGEDCFDAAEAGILHDVTKKLDNSEQLHLCEKYGIILDQAEINEPKLLHARTGAYFARSVFGVSDAVFSAIEWHTTGRENMTRLEKIVYLADMIEPNRSFPGVDELRSAAYFDLDDAMIRALSMSMTVVESRGAVPHERSRAALESLKKGKK